jgi:hypothetical protein
MALAPHAASISVSETLALLDGQFEVFAKGVAEDRYVLWLGSGISFGRVGGLKNLVPRVIEFLRAQIDLGDAACRFKAALEEALVLAHLTEDEKRRIDFTRPFVDWRDAAAITERLIGEYAHLLETQLKASRRTSCSGTV